MIQTSAASYRFADENDSSEVDTVHLVQLALLFYCIILDEWNLAPMFCGYKYK